MSLKSDETAAHVRLFTTLASCTYITPITVAQYYNVTVKPPFTEPWIKEDSVYFMNLVPGPSYVKGISGFYEV